MDIVGKTIQNGEPTPEHPVEIENKINILLAVDDENNSEKEYRLPFLTNIEQQAIETVLSELEKKEKQIDLMAEQLAGLAIFDIEKDEPLVLGDKEEVKQYFTNKVEKEGK